MRLTCFLLEKKKHRPNINPVIHNISQFNPTVSEKKSSILLLTVSKFIQETLNIVNVHVNNG